MTNSSLESESHPVRVFTDHVPTYQRFQTDLLIPSTTPANKITTTAVTYPYLRQYAHVYHQRLSMIGPMIWEQMRQKENDTWNRVNRIIELPEDVECAVVGSIVVEKQAKNGEPTTTTASYYLEDESGRVSIALIDETKLHGTFCTGLVLGLVGTVGIDGVMQVLRIYTAAQIEILQEPTSTLLVGAQNNGHPYIVLASGLDCGSAQASSITRDMLLAYIQGQFCDYAHKLCHVIVAGGLVCSNQPDTITNGCRELDAFAWQLTSVGVPLTLIPGKNDPTTANWPQRPLHKSLLPRSNGVLLTRSPNPYSGTFTTSDGKTTTILGTDGYNVIDLASQCHISELEALHRTMECAHVCPTGPDSIPTQPHAEIDPMVILSDKLPSLYFAGNCSQLETKLITVNAEQTCRLVCLPRFIETGMACLINLDTLGVEVVRFEYESK